MKTSEIKKQKAIREKKYGKDCAEYQFIDNINILNNTISEIRNNDSDFYLEIIKICNKSNDQKQ